MTLGAPSEAQLEDLREQIARLEARLSEDLASRDAERAELRRVEKRISSLAAEARKLDRALADARDRLARVEKKQQQLADENRTQLGWVSRTARAGYMSGRQPLMKLLLNQEQPDTLARLLRYQDYFQSARRQRLDEISRDLVALRQVALQVHEARNDLNTRRQDVDAQQSRLKQARAERQQALAAINRKLDSHESRLGKLRKDEQELEELLRSMVNALTDIPANPGGKPFADLSGDLPWPVTRDIKARFGSRREGPVRWNGVLLEARNGTPVRAIHPGRVVFADWLRGYGLLTIIDHGGGYLSLYGYNQSLLREVGEWISLGDTIALAGDSGGRDESGLYFEIRRNGKPVNPDKWCNSRVTLPPIARN
ncbi:MAG: peptidoglycan DD-metalloendopeptidase family protein [Alcanivoracaceae bacterium]|nr:peptidoglycan DD-metalloendopeptidase family protein [Alcanivoracaceae bacterium]